MSADTARLLRQHFSDALVFEQPDLHVAFENEPPRPTPEKAPWLRFSVRDNGLARAGYTATQSRHIERGRIEMQIFVPAGTGTKTRDQLADWAGEIFRGFRDDSEGVRCGEPEMTTPPMQPGDPYSMRRVSVPWMREIYLAN